MRPGRIVLTLIVGGLCGYLAMLGLLYFGQRDLMYPRDPAPVSSAKADLPSVEETVVATADGERLIAWIVPPQAGKPVLLYFHGNAGNLSRPVRLARFRALTADGTGLFALSYRGYGGSSGSPSEAGLHEDARAAYAAAAARFGAERLVGYGESLGTGVAVRLAAERPLKAVVLEAPYLSTAAVAQLAYPYVPVALLMKDQFRSDEVVAAIRAPLLVLHGERDRVIPFAQGEGLYALAAAPKRFVRFPAGGHENLPALGSVREVQSFLADLAAGTLKAEDRRMVE